MGAATECKTNQSASFLSGMLIPCFWNRTTRDILPFRQRLKAASDDLWQESR